MNKYDQDEEKDKIILDQYAYFCVQLQKIDEFA